MSRIGGFRVPPFSAAMNVAMQTLRQNLPERAAGGGTTAGERVRFAQLNGTHGSGGTAGTGTGTSRGSVEHCEMSELDGALSPSERRPSSVAAGSAAGSDDASTYGGGGGEFGADVQIDEYQAAWNVTNAIQGMFIVSLPFAVLRGGYWAIFAMIGIAYICCYTGKILVECLYEFDPTVGRSVRVRDSYVAIAEECFGRRHGARAVSVAQVIELLMTCILYVVVCGDLMIGSFPGGAVDKRSWMMLVGLLLLPLGFLKSLRHVSVLSFWCTISHLFINAIVVGYCLLQIGDWAWSKVKWSVDLENFPISLGVIVFSYTSQIFLPTLEGNMRDRSRFNWMLNWSHFWAAVFKSLFGYVCFLTFQNDTQQVITNNLRSPGFKGFVNLCLVVKALLSYPLPYYAACELLERALFRGQPRTPFPTVWAPDGELKVWGLAWRACVVIFTVLLAVFIPHFSILMGFIGSFTGTMLSFIWPCYFHLALRRNSMEPRAVAFNYFIIALGVLFGVVGIYDSGSALVRAFKIDLPF